MATELSFDPSARKKKKGRSKLASGLVRDGLQSSLSPEVIPDSRPDPTPEIFQEALEASSSSQPQTLDRADYDYQFLIDLFYDLMEKRGTTIAADNNKKIRLPPPVLGRDGPKKTIWANFEDTSKSMGRTVKHFQDYILSELGTTGTFCEGKLTIRGRFQSKQIQTVIRHYVTEYVICNICKSCDTQMVKEQRLIFITCNDCLAKRSVAAIKTGYVAQIGRRKKE